MINELQLKYKEIDSLYKHICNMEKQKGTIQLVPILKSSLFIVLYNCIESTIYSILEHLHSHLNNYESHLLNAKIMKKIDKVTSNSKSTPQIICTHLPQLAIYLRTEKLFSGNLDHRKIKTIFKGYDINLQDQDTDYEKAMSLLIIKNKRNSLAHGGMKFHEAGRNISSKDLKKIIDHSLSLQEIYISTSINYLNQQLYLK